MTHPPRVLLDTSVLAPEPLWLWTLALAEGTPLAARPQLGVSRGVVRELRHAIRRIDPRLTRVQADRAARLRLDSLTWVSSTPSVQPSRDSAVAAHPRPHVLDLDDAHLDAAALSWDADLLVTDDVRAFAPVPDHERGYALLTADDLLCGLAGTGPTGTGPLGGAPAGTSRPDTRPSDTRRPGTPPTEAPPADTSPLAAPPPRSPLTVVAEALPRYRAHLVRVEDAVGIDAPPGPPSHHLRRSRARRFAKLVVRAQRAQPDDGPRRRSAG